MIYDTMDKPPKMGSVMEALCLMIQMRRQVTELYHLHTVVQAVRTAREDSPEAIQESFNRYRDALLPYLKDEIAREHSEIVQALKEEARRGPMVVRQIGGSDVGRRLRKKLQERTVKPPRLGWRRKKRW